MEDLIFGYTREQISAAQQGQPLTRQLPGVIPGYCDPLLAEDVSLLCKHGLNKLENEGYHNVVDRLAQAGLLDPKHTEVHKDAELLLEYTKEIGWNPNDAVLTVQCLIDSHRRLVEELNHTSRKEWRDEMSKAREYVKNLNMDSTWIKIDKLRTMTVQELVNMLGED